MDELIWDMTKAAPVHAALAGVFATLAIALLAILSSIALLPTNSSVNGSASATRASAIKSHPQLFRLLVLATLLMLVSAIIWGGLAGQPSVERMNSVLKAEPRGPGLDTLSAVIRAVEIRESTIGAAAVTILAVGGLVLVAGMFELVTAIRSNDEQKLASFVARAYSVLAALAVYEIVYFIGVMLALISNQAVWAQNAIALGIAGFTALACVPQRLLRLKWGILRLLTWLLRADDIDSAQVRVAVAAGLFATLAYALSPTGSFQQGADPIDWIDHVAAVFILLAGVSSIIYALASAWAMLPNIGPSAIAGVLLGENREQSSDANPPRTRNPVSTVQRPTRTPA